MGLDIRDVAHSFGNRMALDGVSFTVVPGVITGLLGPNGAGKTTLLRIMLGVLSPDRGKVMYDGRLVGEKDRRHWGYMPQERGLYPGMPAVTRSCTSAGCTVCPARRRRAGRALLEELGLEDRWSDRTDKLCGGMQQRLQLATSLVHDPAVIVLDEPFAGLDPVAVASLSETLRRGPAPVGRCSSPATSSTSCRNSARTSPWSTTAAQCCKATSPPFGRRRAGGS